MFSAKAKAANGTTPGGVVDKRDEVGLAALSAIGNGGAVHDIAHPQFAGVAGRLKRRRSAVGASRLPLVEEPFAGEQAMDGRRGEMDIGREVALAGGVDHAAHGQGRVVLLDRDQQFGDVRRHAAGATAVAAVLRIESVEAALAVKGEPVAHGLGGDAGTHGAGDDVVLLGLGAQSRADAGRPGGPGLTRSAITPYRNSATACRVSLSSVLAMSVSRSPPSAVR